MTVIENKKIQSISTRLVREVRRLPRNIAKLYRRYVLKDLNLIAHKRWKDVSGDQILRLNYPLNEHSVVFDLGGYRGDFTAAIYSCYHCNIFLFEPVGRLFEVCTRRFANIPRVHCYSFGLSAYDEEIVIDDNDNSSSLVKLPLGINSVIARTRKMSSFLREEHISHIDLLKINIEGGEFDLLSNLITEKLIDRMRYIQVQFHTFVQDATNRRDAIRSSLRQTHDEMWNYPFVWESWALKDQ